MAAGSRSYTELSTHVASTSTRCETHAPRATKVSAAATCFASSRVTSRTSTFVSTARMAPLHVRAHAGFHLLDAAGPRGALREQGPMEVFGGIAPGAANDDFLALLVPFQDRARADPELLPHFHRDGDLPLYRDFRVGDRHDRYITTVMKNGQIVSGRGSNGLRERLQHLPDGKRAFGEFARDALDAQLGRPGELPALLLHE